MSDAVTTASATPPAFTPSELVVLFGDRFSEEAGMLTAKEEVLTSGKKVSAERLGLNAALAALLAAESGGSVRFDLRTKKALFGLVSRQVLHAVPTGGGAAWPANSVEAVVTALLAGGEKEVETVVKEVLAVESHNPWQRLIALVKRGMAERGLLEAGETKVLGFITVAAYTLPDSTRALADAQPLGPVQALLGDAERARPEVHRALVKAVKSAATWMTESRDD